MNAATETRVAEVSHAGRRPYQEDSALIEVNRDYALVVVADGMGGHAAGDVASAIAVDTLREFDRRGLFAGAAGENLVDAAHVGNRRILEYVGEHPESAGMGTTLVAAVVRNGHATVAHAGDSRAYLVTADEVVQLTRDHSAVQAAIDAGTLSEAEAGTSPYRHAILRNLGDEEFPGPEIGEFDLPSGCVLLLTSDGAHGFLSEAEILEHLSGTPNLKAGIQNLLRVAYHNGSDDNLTIVACEVGKFPRSKRRSQKPIPIAAPGPSVPRRRRRADRVVPVVFAAFLVVCLAVLLYLLRNVMTHDPAPPRPVPVAVTPSPALAETAPPTLEETPPGAPTWATPVPEPETPPARGGPPSIRGEIAREAEAGDETGETGGAVEVSAGPEVREETEGSEEGTEDNPPDLQRDEPVSGVEPTPRVTPEPEREAEPTPGSPSPVETPTTGPSGPQTGDENREGAGTTPGRTEGEMPL